MGAIHFLRHGQASFGAADYDVLSGRGEIQSRLAGAELARRGAVVTGARCGTLARQKTTAKLALAEVAPGIAATEDARWNEYDHRDIAAHHGGDAAPDGADPRAFQAALETALAAWIDAGDDSPCAESWPAFRRRVRTALDELIPVVGTGEQVLVCTSGGVLATLACELLGAPDSTMVTMNRVAVNAGVSTVVTGRSGTSLLSFNEHAHFAGETAQLLSYR